MSSEGSNTLLTVRVRPVVAVTVLFIGLVLLLIALDGLFLKHVFPQQIHVVFKLVLWILFVAAALVTIVGIKQLLRPARIFGVTDNGIVQYMRAGVALERGQLIPWERMGAMEITEASGYHGKRSRIIVIAVQVHVDEEWPKERLYNFDEATGRVMLDAFSGKPAGKTLLEELVRLRTSGQQPVHADAAD